MKYSLIATVAALCSTAMADDEAYARCNFHVNTRYNGVLRPNINPMLTITDVDATDTIFDFALENGRKDSEYRIDFWQADNGSIINEKSCRIIGEPTRLSTGFYVGETGVDSRNIPRWTEDTCWLYIDDEIEDGNVYAILEDDIDIVACCRLQKHTNPVLYAYELEQIDKVLD